MINHQSVNRYLNPILMYRFTEGRISQYSLSEDPSDYYFQVWLKWGTPVFIYKLYGNSLLGRNREYSDNLDEKATSRPERIFSRKTGSRECLTKWPETKRRPHAVQQEFGLHFSGDCLSIRHVAFLSKIILMFFGRNIVAVRRRGGGKEQVIWRQKDQKKGRNVAGN